MYESKGHRPLRGRCPESTIYNSNCHLGTFHQTDNSLVLARVYPLKSDKLYVVLEQTTPHLKFFDSHLRHQPAFYDAVYC